MAYVTKILAPEEKLIGIARLHWIYVLKGLAWFLVLALAGWALDQVITRLLYIIASTVNADGMSGMFLSMSNNIMLFMMAGGLLIFGLMVMKVLVTEVGLSNRRILYKTGWLFVNVRQIDLEEIRGETMDLGWFGRILGYAYILLDCRFIGDVRLPAIEYPERFMRALHQTRAIPADTLSVVLGKGNGMPVGRVDEKLTSGPETPQPAPQQPTPEITPGQQPVPEVNPPSTPQPEIQPQPVPHAPPPPQTPPPQPDQPPSQPEQPTPGPISPEPPLQQPTASGTNAPPVIPQPAPVQERAVAMQQERDENAPVQIQMSQPQQPQQQGAQGQPRNNQGQLPLANQPSAQQQQQPLQPQESAPKTQPQQQSGQSESYNQGATQSSQQPESQQEFAQPQQQQSMPPQQQPQQNNERSSPSPQHANAQDDAQKFNISPEAMAQVIQQVMPQMAEQVVKQMTEQGLVKSEQSGNESGDNLDTDLIDSFDDARLDKGDKNAVRDKVEYAIH